MTTGPVEGVPITGPLCQIRGGVPFAASLVMCTWQPDTRATGRTIPPKWPERALPWTFALHAFGKCDEGCCVAAFAATPTAVRAAVPVAVASIRVMRSARPLSGVFIHLLRHMRREPGLPSPALTNVPRQKTPFRG